MEIKLLSLDSQEKVFDVPEVIVDHGSSPISIYYGLNAALSNRRIGSASTKERSLVSGSNIKPWRQKGTGRARAGSRKSPIWRGGGIVFGPHPRDYRLHISRKQKAVALCSGICQKIAQRRAFIIEPMVIHEAKTKSLCGILDLYLQYINIKKGEYCKLLIVANGAEDTSLSMIRRAGRNIPYLSIQQYARISLHTLFYSDYVFFYTDSLIELSIVLNNIFKKRQCA